MGFCGKKGRQTKWKQLTEETRTFILYESPYRLVKLLEEIKENLGETRNVCVSRELSKLFEENKRGAVTEVLNHFKQKTLINMRGGSKNRFFGLLSQPKTKFVRF